jgi:Ran GTPase-activating protein (RanGAP) involved in mRNA processing and transport
MERLALCLRENSSITTLRLTNTFQGEDGDESMVAFVKRLPGMSHLRHLTLGGNEFGEAGEQALVEVLEEQAVHPLL